MYCMATFLNHHQTTLCKIKRKKQIEWTTGLKTSFILSKYTLVKITLLYNPRMESITRSTVDALDIAIGSAL